jgi:thiosulfate/3-mercaptopyruvate sulfurtransferase
VIAGMLVDPAELLAGQDVVLFDCRFSLADPSEGQQLYLAGHIPGACYLDLNLDLAGPVGKHGGRHPLPDPARFAATLARYGVGPDTAVIAYDDSRLAFAARLWWMMRAIGYTPPRLLNGGYLAFLRAGGEPEEAVSDPRSCNAGAVTDYSGCCDIEGLREAQVNGAVLVDSREPRRYEGIEELIDPVAGHIPGAVNHPWQGVTGADGTVHDKPALQAHWNSALEAQQMVVYCGSGVTACVNLFSLALLGRDDATLYAGSWSDWCSYL